MINKIIVNNHFKVFLKLCNCMQNHYLIISYFYCGPRSNLDPLTALSTSINVLLAEQLMVILSNFCNF